MLLKNGNKAPGPDGFNLMFIHKSWKTIKDDIMNFFKEFHLNGKLVKGLNSSFITLIPKVENPMGLGYFRPISLVGCVYKILSKVLSVRLKRVVVRIIGEM